MLSPYFTVDDTFKEALPWEDGIMDRLMVMDGEVARHHKNRRTVRFTIGGEAYYIKTHSGTSLGEILKNLVNFSLPVTGARRGRSRGWRGYKP